MAKLAYGDKVNIEYCNYDDVNEKVKEYVITGEHRNYDFTLITDISVNEDVADLIDKNIYLEDIQLLDHHNTSSWLEERYCWATVGEYMTPESEDCGTHMLYDYLLNTVNITEWQTVDFVEVVRRYDTWEWKTKHHNDEPKKWNDLFHIMGRDRFICMIIERLKNSQFGLTETDLMLLELEQEQINRYIESKQKLIIEKEILGYKAGIVFAERYHSECGNTLSELNPHLDFIILINPSYSVSYRTIKDIDLGKDIAKIFGGGGHPKASGSPLPENFSNNVIDMIFNLQ